MAWFDSLSDLLNRTPPGLEPAARTLPVRPGDPNPAPVPLRQPPTMRAPTWKERVSGAMQSGVEAVVDNPAVRALLFAAGSSPEEQRARFTDPAVAQPPVSQGVALANRRPAAALNAMVRVAEGANPSAKGLQYLQEAVEYYAQKYPRLLSHLDEVVVQPTMSSKNAIGKNALNVANMDMAHAGQIAQRPGGVKYLNEHRRPIGTMNINAEAMDTWALPEQAREVLGHELGHTGQFLSDPSRMHKAYKEASDIFGYAGNPAEDLANIVGRRHRYGPEATVLQAEDRARARQNWDFFRNEHPRETLRGPGQ